MAHRTHRAGSAEPGPGKPSIFHREEYEINASQLIARCLPLRPLALSPPQWIVLACAQARTIHRPHGQRLCLLREHTHRSSSAKLLGAQWTHGRAWRSAYRGATRHKFRSPCKSSALKLANISTVRSLDSASRLRRGLPGGKSLEDWYETIGANGWRLEEFQHYYGNATFDDAGTSAAAQLILRLYVERGDRRFEKALDRAIGFVLAAQFGTGVADGGWPQRFPAYHGSVSRMPWPERRPSWLPDDVTHGMEDGDYTQHVTFNDDVLGENIKFLLMCVSALGRRDLIAPVRRAMECLRRMQQPGPQAGWGLQHLSRAKHGRQAGAPAGARSYEPRALTTHTTQTNIQQLFHYFRLSGDRKYLSRVPEALDWLDSCRLTERQIAENPLLAGRTHPTFVELGTNRARFVHRFGSNIRNGAYYHDYDHRGTLSHYSAGRSVDVEGLRDEYGQLASMTPAEVAKIRARSPLVSDAPIPLPPYFSPRDIQLSDLLRDAPLPLPVVSDAEAAALVAGLGDRDHWLTRLDAVTNPYEGPGARKPYDGKAYMSKNVGDLRDTSPYNPQDPPAEPPYQPREAPLGISSAAYVANMAKLIGYVAQPAG
ncbi:pectate lyase [Streptomyces malaysiensis subsp. malaysiensis]|nr:pectate lyase [Streptomyces malaysiensis]